MLSAAETEQLIVSLVHPLDGERDRQTVDLTSAHQRILAQPVTSSLDFPHWDNSAMDGYAVRYDDVQDCSAEHPITLEIVEDIPAGYQPTQRIQPGQAARILTGSMMPPGADTVVMQENTRRDNQQVTILAAPQPRAFVRQRGAYYQGGTPLLPTGTLIKAPELAVLAAAQCLRVEVYRRPRVAILSTGSELVAPDHPLQPGQIVDSNHYALAALVQQTGAEAIALGIVPDDPEALREAIASAIAQADMVLSSGGVSVGDYDYVDQILADLGATIHSRAVAVKPGKPLTVATFNRDAQSSPILYFGLPGNPVSALVSFWRFVQPALRKLSGLPSGWGPMWVKGRSLDTLKSDGKRESYLWGRTHLKDGEYEFELAQGSHLSGNLINLARTNSLAMLPIGTPLISAGDPVQIMLVGG